MSRNPARGVQTDAASHGGVRSNPLTSKEVTQPAPRKKARKPAKKKEAKFSLGVKQSDPLGFGLAAIPISNKDKELVAVFLMESLGIQDVDRFMREVHRTDIPTAKT